MRTGFRLFLIIFFSVYGLVNLYIGLHGRHFLRAAGIALSPRVYWPLFWLTALSYILSRLLNGHAPDILYRPLHLLGACWLAAMVYFLLFLLAVDAMRLAHRILGFLPPWTSGSRFISFFGAAAILTVALLLLLGSRAARNPGVTRYEVSIEKELPGREDLRIVLVSDVHLGSLVNGGMLNRLVEGINGLAPDLVLLAGDILDEDLGFFVKQGMDADLGRIRAPLGVYAVPGNHEYLGGGLEEFSLHLESAGIRMLRDQVVLAGGLLYIAGRDDRSGPRFTGGSRLSLASLTMGLNPDLPLIVMDHQPADLWEARAAGADLQVSGHTHRGQLWPGNLITRRVYEIDYGLQKKGGTSFVVSSGYGTWGPPVRIGTRSEIVLIRLVGRPAGPGKT